MYLVKVSNRSVSSTKVDTDDSVGFAHIVIRKDLVYTQGKREDLKKKKTFDEKSTVFAYIQLVGQTGLESIFSHLFHSKRHPAVA